MTAHVVAGSVAQFWALVFLSVRQASKTSLRGVPLGSAC